MLVSVLNFSSVWAPYRPGCAVVTVPFAVIVDCDIYTGFSGGNSVVVSTVDAVRSSGVVTSGLGTVNSKFTRPDYQR